MSRWITLSIGLAAALATGWIAYGPAGMGEAYVDRLEAQAQAVVREADIPGVAVHLGRAPLSRTAFLAGPANDFQREGMGLLPGLNDRVGGVPGIAGVDWERREGGMPLLAELLLLAALAWLIGLGIGKLLFRPKRESFL
jgi:hypothetical protein